MTRTIKVNQNLINPNYTIEQIYYTAIRGEKEFKVRARQKKFFVDFKATQKSYSCPKWIWQNKNISKQAAVLAILIRSYMNVTEGTVKPLDDRMLLKFFCNTRHKAKSRDNARQRVAKYFQELAHEGYVETTWTGINFDDFDARNKYRQWNIKVLPRWYNYCYTEEATETGASRPQKQGHLATKAGGKLSFLQKDPSRLSSEESILSSLEFNRPTSPLTFPAGQSRDEGRYVIEKRVMEIHKAMVAQASSYGIESLRSYRPIMERMEDQDKDIIASLDDKTFDRVLSLIGTYKIGTMKRLFDGKPSLFNILDRAIQDQTRADEAEKERISLNQRIVQSQLTLGSYIINSKEEIIAALRSLNGLGRGWGLELNKYNYNQRLTDFIVDNVDFTRFKTDTQPAIDKLNEVSTIEEALALMGLPSPPLDTNIPRDIRVAPPPQSSREGKGETHE